MLRATWSSAYRTVHLFYKNTESDKLVNVAILNASMDQLADSGQSALH